MLFFKEKVLFLYLPFMQQVALHFSAMRGAGPFERPPFSGDLALKVDHQ